MTPELNGGVNCEFVDVSLRARVSQDGCNRVGVRARVKERNRRGTCTVAVCEYSGR